MLSHKIWYLLEQISYSGYLFHFTFMFWYFHKGASNFKNSEYSVLTGFIFNRYISFVAIQTVSTLMYLFVEQPFQRLRKKLLRLNPMLPSIQNKKSNYPILFIQKALPEAGSLLHSSASTYNRNCSKADHRKHSTSVYPLKQLCKLHFGR